MRISASVNSCSAVDARRCCSGSGSANLGCLRGTSGTRGFCDCQLLFAAPLPQLLTHTRQARRLAGYGSRNGTGLQKTGAGICRGRIHLS